MGNELQVFRFKGQAINILTKEDVNFEFDGDFLIHGKQTVQNLGYSENSKPLRELEEDEKYLVKNSDVLKQHYRKLNNAGEIFITESGLYSLAFNSKLQSAKEFTKWVKKEILPSIRRHGAYMTENVLDEVINNPDFGIKLLTELKKEKEEKKKLQLQNKQKDQLIGELKPKADYTDRILKNKGLVTTTQIAKDYGMSAQEMNKLLHDLKVQYKQSGQWLLYSKYHNKGYTHSETIDIVRSDGTPDITMNTKWTQKGRLFLYNLLKSKNVLPIIEQTAESEIAVGREI
ncbi:phage antirepressor KilAC domain-containing protein [Clostridium botulinum]|uniref:phage antirepressor KilAC domain-containing protein n=1 Tax=Clostridium botulinum TaxID=1491 RepID=UPI0006AC4571|nr:phage antirepressor KilAC domain-containing protein [Clostridium botulinum]KOR54821.1 phage antirepressor protein [Clostridium botulinum]MBD5587688.1 phage antirepressor KilAC domain-containing protein [Clostridium botulinum]MBY6839534.1 phage antirepressor KilAC domain-containing protein [Clostridium botulinum]MCR1166820.1 phage antirepressor KilAC domain-containing protein [Clostridium botulinum]NFM78190.1 phage antirepressor protein [Clostridium botulinum]